MPQEGATIVLRHTGATVRGKKLLDAIRSGEGGGIEIACPAIKRDSDRFDFAAGEFSAARKRIAPVALRTLVSAFADDLTELAAACQQLIADVPGDVTEQLVERYYGGRVEISAFVVADTAIAGRYGESLVALRHALASGADPVPLVAAIASKLRTMARVAGHREPAGALAARLGLKDWQVDRARRDLAGWSDATLGMAIQAAARADAEVKGGSRDSVFSLERLVTVIATKAPFGS
jgi:DNA polymerase III subunit delta